MGRHIVSRRSRACSQLKQVRSRRSSECSENVIMGSGTYAPLYCATSSPRTKTLSFRSISSAMASLSASRTVISFWPDAYPLLAIDGVAAAARKAGRKAGAGRVDAIRREAGRRSLEAAIVRGVRVCGCRRSGEVLPWGE